MASRKKARQRISYVLPLANSTGGHRLGVNSLALDIENSILYSGGRDGILCAWKIDDIASKNPKSQIDKQIHAHTHWVNDILLADGKRALVSASSDITVKVWRPFSEDTSHAVDIGKHTDYIKCLASPGENSDWVASGSLDHTIRLWDLTGAGERLTIATGTDENREKGSIYALCARPSVVASGGPDSVLRLWDPRSGKRSTKFVGHTDNIRSILMNETGDVVMTASSDQTIKIWSVAAGRCISTLTMHNSSVWSLYSSHPQLSLFYSADRSGMIAKTDLTGSENMDDGLSIAIAHEHGGVAKLVAGNGSIWSATASSSINRWMDVDTNTPLEVSNSSSRNDGVSQASKDMGRRKEQADARSEIPLDCVLKVSMTTSQSFRDKEDPSALGHTRRVSEVPISPDADEIIRPYHQLPVETIEGQNGLIKHEVLNDRRRVLTLDTAGEVVLWDLLQCRPIRSFGKRHLADVRPEVDTTDSIENWCIVATKAGSLTVGLEERDCFNAEIYADECDYEGTADYKEDGRINLGKWVLRYLFAGLIDEEIKRDAVYRKQLERSKTESNSQAKGLNLGPLPPPGIQFSNGSSGDSESITTPRLVASGMPAVTPGFSIGIASPGLTQVMSNGTTGPVKTPGTSDERGRMSGDYFSSKPPLPVPAKIAESTTDAALPESTQASTENDEKSKSPGLFGKKFRLPLKKLGRSSADTAKQPAVEDRAEEPDKTLEKEEIPIEDNMFGVIQKMRIEYDNHLQHYPDRDLLSAVTPSLPTETPVINPSARTAILIQEDTPESGGLADLYRGTVGGVAKDADKLEKVAPTWLGDLLLRNQIPFREIQKISFILSPYEDLLPAVSTEGNSRLTANRMLRSRKIMSYITERIDPNGSNEENALKPEEYIELYCHDQRVSPEATLASIHRHVWKTGGDVVLYYKGNGRKPHLEQNWILEKARLKEEEAEKGSGGSATQVEAEAKAV